MFENRKIVIATKHAKEKIIKPLFEKELGVQSIFANNFDTDILGTFTGEKERIDDPLTTVRNKCLMAMELNDCDMGVASEGSFGPHPFFFFGYADDELVILSIRKIN